MPPTTEDGRLDVVAANRLLVDVNVYRCSGCMLALVRHGAIYHAARHSRCGGHWELVDNPLRRTVLLRFLTREMLGCPTRPRQ